VLRARNGKRLPGTNASGKLSGASYCIPGQHGEYDLYNLGTADAPGSAGENQDVTNRR
jgi:Type II secretion system (T2SS), protein G